MYGEALKADLHEGTIALKNKPVNLHENTKICKKVI